MNNRLEKILSSSPINNIELKNQDYYVIAELANAHCGDLERAKKIIYSHKECGAHAVKFQIVFANELLIPYHSSYSKFKKREWTNEQWKEIIKYTCSLGFDVGADIFGKKSFEIAEKNNISFYKIHSSDISNHELIINMIKTDKPILLSGSGSNELELFKAIDLFNSSYMKKLCIMIGFQSFPTEINDINLACIFKLYEKYGLSVGICDHLDGGSYLAHQIPAIAYAMGCRVFEKHITINRNEKKIDYHSSLEPTDFKKIISFIEDVKSLIGNCSESITKSEKKYRDVMKKYPVVKRDFNRGEILDSNDILFRRIDSIGIHLYNKSFWIGRKVKKSIKSYNQLRAFDFELNIGICVIARFGSSRLPGKCILPIRNKPAIEYLFERTHLLTTPVIPILCTSINSDNDELVLLAKKNKMKVIQGDEKNIIDRLLLAIEKYQLDYVIRVTGDDILLDPFYANKAIELCTKNNYDYVSCKKLPGGVECEVFTSESIRLINKYAENLEYTEYLTYYMDSPLFNCGILSVPKKHRRNYSITMDNSVDYKNLENVINTLKKNKLEINLDNILFIADEIYDNTPRKISSGQHKATNSIKKFTKLKLHKVI